MSNLTFHTLHANFTEIYAAMHAQPDTGAPLPLEATSYTTVRYQKSWIGQFVIAWHRIWRWILHELAPTLDKTLQTITKIFTHAVLAAYEARQERIWQGMHMLDSAFTAPTLLEQRTRYALFLTDDLKESWWGNDPLYLKKFDKRKLALLDQEKEIQLKHVGINFQQATYNFWEFILKNQDKDICSSFLELALPSAVQEKTSPLLDRSFFKTLKKEFRWLHFESVLEQPIPLVPLAKLHDPSSLTMQERKQLTDWVKAINHHQKKLSPKLFAVVLAEALNVIQLQGGSTVTLQDILYWLFQQGCALVEHECPKHMDWREKLGPGSLIECNGKELELGQQLSPDKEIDDVYKIFELEEYPDYVVKIANNRFRLLIEAKQVEDEQAHWGVRFVNTITDLDGVSGLDQKGFCVVQEKLTCPFADYEWTSDNTILTKEDEEYALVLANHLYCMQQWQASSQNLSFKHLMWDAEGVLKTTRPLKKGPPNYIEWEDKCIKAAKKNVHILNFLMHVTKFYEHEMADYYRQAVEYTLESGEIDLVERPLPIGHRESYYEQHAQQLCQQALTLRKTCCKQVIAHVRKEQNTHKLVNQIETSAINQLLTMYRSCSTPGRLSDDLQKEVISIFVKKSAPFISQSSDADKAYYQSKHDLMMKYNQAVLTAEADQLAAVDEDLTEE